MPLGGETLLGGSIATAQGGSFIAWNASEQRRLLEACRGLAQGSHEPPPAYLYPLVLVALRTGLKVQDLLRLEWRHVEGAFERIHLPADVAWSGRALEIPLQRDARSLLAALQRRSMPPRATSGIVTAMGVPDADGKPDVRRIQKDFDAVRERAGIRAGNLDSLRLTFIRNCASAAIPIADAARFSDCRNRELLLRIYSSVERERRA